MFCLLSPTAANQGLVCIDAFFSPSPTPKKCCQLLLCRVQYKWESEQSNSYSIKEDNTDKLEGSGTRIVLHLKEDSEEYLDDFKVQEESWRRNGFCVS